MLITVLFLVVCALIAVAAVPLMLKLIPPNPIYGIRTARTTADAATWFIVNEVAGRAFLIASGIAAILLIMYSGTWLKSGWAQLVVMVVVFGAAVAVTLVFERRLGEK